MKSEFLIHDTDLMKRTKGKDPKTTCLLAFIMDKLDEQGYEGVRVDSYRINKKENIWTLTADIEDTFSGPVDVPTEQVYSHWNELVTPKSRFDLFQDALANEDYELCAKLRDEDNG